MSEVHRDKNTTPPFATPQTTAVDGIWASDMDDLENKERHEA